jgi:hypothetical protein
MEEWKADDERRGDPDEDRVSHQAAHLEHALVLAREMIGEEAEHHIERTGFVAGPEHRDLERLEEARSGLGQRCDVPSLLESDEQVPPCRIGVG